MAQVTRTASKAKFQNGDVPTENDFIDLHDSVTWYDESGGVSDGDKGDIVVSGSGATWTIEDAFKRNPSLNIYNALGSSIKAEPMYSVVNTTTAGSLADGSLRFIAVWLPKAATITGVKWYQTTTGDYTADQYNGVGLYSYSGGTLTLEASSTNDGDIWKAAATTWHSKAFSATYSASAGLYFVGALYNSSAQTTAPSIGAAPNVSTVISVVDFTNSARFLGSLAAQNSLIASVSMGSVAGAVNNFYFALY